MLAVLLRRDETSSPEIERLEIEKVVLDDFRTTRLPEVTRAAIARARTYEVDPEFGTVTPFAEPLVVRVALAPGDARTRECRVARGEAGPTATSTCARRGGSCTRAASAADAPVAGAASYAKTPRLRSQRTASTAPVIASATANAIRKP